ncbi:T9SS type A sorting domain-containing protein [Pontibacter sp. SGAir0037]|uniref:T9SS type A sorting domain-containing protein n=1 Tax=Pontibacter sp. SGAir0037 TaxID=2571030 RepID=UPI0010F561D8|nr:T9SS type A sorting domain-containing protein [Pontibacter sp. SGAir0037]
MIALPATLVAQVKMEKHSKSYRQSFDELPASGTGAWASGQEYLPGWRVTRSVTTDDKLTAGNGSSNTGGLYSYGSNNSSDRALGAVTSLNAGEFAYNLLLQNKTGATVSAVEVSYYGEQWRSGSVTTNVQHISCWYIITDNPSAVNLSPKTDIGWTEVPALHFKSPVNRTAGGALNGNSPANRSFLATFLPDEIPAEHYLLLRWKDADEPEMDHGLAIDDVSVSWTVEDDYIVLPVELMNFKASIADDFIVLDWDTASETENDFYEVERSLNGHFFQSIGKVMGAGNSSQTIHYTFKDMLPVAGTLYYRLKQVDFNKKVSYSSIIAKEWAPSAPKAILFPTITSEWLTVELPHTSSSHMMQVISKAGHRVMTQTISRRGGYYVLDVSGLSRGTYLLVLQDEQGQKKTQQFIKK